MSPKTVLLDGNIYDRLADDKDSLQRITKLIASGQLRVIATPMVVDELKRSPFGGVPRWFPVQLEPEAVAGVGYAKVGWARIGPGDIYRQHGGDSKKAAPDAIVAESAHSLADLLITEDKRCRKRLAELSSKCQVLSYASFTQWLKTLSSASHS